ncbi:PD-(D/E)XK nuclease family protein [Senegalia massiliensis]|uniref:PD-(D/E)XK nuclease family protein n=1 Tax=Senegalia massiliensis TaxID=1720316 RepID=UPI001032562A|nr:PD-(D/E)XK nuclease family protein [Senegalia massiliensis]
MSRKIIFFGDINNNFKNKLIDEARKYISNNNCEKMNYILPSRDLLMKYRKLLLSEVKGAFNLNVITFDDIVDKLIDKSIYTEIQDIAKKIILKDILKKLEQQGKIKYYKDIIKNDSFIESLIYIIGEIKRSLVKSEDIKVEENQHIKFKEIFYIYKEYQLFLYNNNLLDKEEVFLKSINNFEKNKSAFENLELIIIDEFFDFRSQEFEMIKQLSKMNIDILINIPYKTDKEYITIRKTIERLEDLGFILKQKENDQKDLFDKLGIELFSNKKNENVDTSKINIIRADNLNLEIMKIANDIKEDVLGKILPNKIAVITDDLNNYGKLMREKLNSYNIPCNLDKKEKMFNIPIARDILNILDLINDNNIRNVVKVLKSPYLNIDYNISEEIIEKRLNYLYDNYNESNVHIAISKEKEKLNYLINASNDKKHNQQLETIQIIESEINILLEKIPELNSIRYPQDIIKVLNTLLIDYKIKDNIEELYQLHKDEDIYYRDVAFINNLNMIFEKLETYTDIIPNNNFDIKYFMNLLKDLFKEEEIIIKEKDKNGVHIISPSLSRGLEFENIYILGLSEGNYPKTKKNNWFFNKKNMNLLNRKGIIYPSNREIYDKEKLLFAISISRAKSKLVLSYCNENTSELSIPSIFIEEVSKNIGLDDKYIENINSDYIFKKDLINLYNNEELLQNILYRYSKGEDMSREINMYNTIDKYAISKIMSNINVEFKRNSHEFSEFDGNINEEYNFIDKTFSITSLETYGQCPMKYFFKYVLNINEEEKEKDFDNRDKGNIYHMVLAEFYSRYKNKIYDYIDNKIVEIKNIEDIVTKILIRIVKNELQIKNINKMWNLRIEFMKKVILEFLYQDLNRLKEKQIYPKFFEYKFGYKEDFILETEYFNVKLLGKIDRIDIKDEKIIIYDYKTSQGLKLKDIEKGTSLQLPIYLMAMKKRGYEILSGGYIVLNDKKYINILAKKESKDILGEKKTLNEEKWQDIIEITKDKINRYIHGIKSGDFFVKPQECSPYCPYKEICRYNKERIDGKDVEYDKTYREPETSY